MAKVAMKEITNFMYELEAMYNEFNPSPQDVRDDQKNNLSSSLLSNVIVLN